VADIPVRTYFMGIFDTVASVGFADAVPGFDGHMAWADNTMPIHPMVEQTVHFVALHEQRAAFPLENANVGRQLGYPGMHSDVGGGYTPGEQGKGMPPSDGGTDMLSQVPLVDMHHAAIKAGVPLMTMQEVNARAILKPYFTVPPALRETFNAFLREHGVPRNQPLDVATRRHAEQYLQWRAHRAATLGNQPFFQRALAKDQKDLREANQQMSQQAHEMVARRQANATPEGRRAEAQKDAIRAGSPVVGRLLVEDGKDPLGKSEAQMLAVYEAAKPLQSAIVKLFDDYVHDSRAGFRIGKFHEPAGITGGYFRYRRVFSNR
jgi:hypothetical protein